MPTTMKFMRIAALLLVFGALQYCNFATASSLRVVIGKDKTNDSYRQGAVAMHDALASHREAVGILGCIIVAIAWWPIRITGGR